VAHTERGPLPAHSRLQQFQQLFDLETVADKAGRMFLTAFIMWNHSAVRHGREWSLAKQGTAARMNTYTNSLALGSFHIHVNISGHKPTPFYAVSQKTRHTTRVDNFMKY